MYLGLIILGVKLSPLLPRKQISFKHLSNKYIAIDGNNMLYQFLALIRTPDGRPLTDSRGRITSHLIGLLYRTTHLIIEHNIKTVFIFDGKPPRIKSKELEKRREERKKLKEQWIEAIERGDLRTAWSKAVRMDSLSKTMVDDAKRLLKFLGIPVIQAPSEGEAQAAYMAKKGDVWCASSQDYDSLLFGAPRLVRNLTLTGRKAKPSKGIVYRLLPELITLNDVLNEHSITYEQLIDIAILIGTDYYEGIHGVGPKTALKLIKKFGTIENLPAKYLSKLDMDIVNYVRDVFKKPEVTDNYSLEFRDVDGNKIIEFLCDERDFNRERVEKVIYELKMKRKITGQSSLESWF